MRISDFILPILIGGILFYGLIKGVDIYSEFIEGAFEGAKSAVKILPYIVAIIFAINLFVQSGAEGFIVSNLSPVTSLIGLPPELLSLIIVKPLSGGGSYGVIKTLLDSYGADSYIGRCASVIMGSAETVFYTAAVYFGAVGIKNIRYTIKVGLITHAASVIAALAVCKYMF
nr:nucleoside recognition domain-containing protein [Sedimentibacter sp.]